MKKYFFVLLAFLVCTFQTSRAYVYFTIYFSDGTKSEAFYATDVDSICYSKIGLDSLEYVDWQVQEIYTCDSVYRYPLAQIDSLSFKDVDINELAQDFANANNTIIPLYLECSSPAELLERLSTIANINGIENMWVDKSSLYVKIKDMEPMTFYYPPSIEPNISDELLAQITSSSNTMSRRKVIEEHHCINNPKACIVNPLYYDDMFFESKAILNILSSHFEEMGITTDIIKSPTPDFYDNDMFNYDLLFIITHGNYDYKSNKHWLFVGEELVRSLADFIDIRKEDAKDILNTRGNYRCSKKNIRYSWDIEKRNGIPVAILRTSISEDFIKYASGRFDNNAIVFATACESLMGNDNLGKIFYGKGASCYIGYNDSNTIGHYGGYFFFSNLMNGRCASSSYKSIPLGACGQDYYEYKRYYENGKYCDNYLYTDSLADSDSRDPNILYEIDNNKYYLILDRSYHPRLIMIPEDASSCITSPKTLEISAENDSTMCFKGQMNLLNNLKIVDSFKYGFQWSTNPDMSEAIDSVADNKNYDDGSHYMTWEMTLNMKKLQPNTTYYYRAYMNDGYSNCYGEIKSFKGPEIKPATLTVRNVTYFSATARGRIDGHEFLDETMKFGIAYIDVRTARNDTIWCEATSIGDDGIFSVELNSLKPQTTYRFFAYLIIDGKTYSGTKRVFTTEEDTREAYYVWDGANMNATYYYDRNRESRGGTTISSEHVVNRINFAIQTVTFDSSFFEYHPQIFTFGNCSKLREINNLIYLNTDNISDMCDMFSGCSSLKSLDLSNFNTSKVTRFGLSSYLQQCGMFSYCSSLTELNLKNFNISNANASDMRNMFRGCSSLTSVDLSSFYTSNVTCMENMFLGCSSLTSLDLSNFDTSNVKWMSSMFMGCSSLTSIDVSSFDTYNASAGDMFRECSSLTVLDLSSFRFPANGSLGSFDMSGMFRDCRSLRTIYAGNWNTSDTYSYDDPPFYGCPNLRGGQGTKVGDNIYGYDDKGNPLTYYVRSDRWIYARIDGGKDKPGLFTQK